jgi:hypothetical protein
VKRQRKTTGVPLVPVRITRWIGLWPAKPQLTCPHPEHRERRISGDERNYGFVRQCMECGYLQRDWR